MQKHQFDEYLGGEISLPREINILQIVTARVPEMIAMTKYLEQLEAESPKPKKIPMHMRRRLMSHNTKQIPRRWRDVCKQMDESGLSKNNKERHGNTEHKNDPSKASNACVDISDT